MQFQSLFKVARAGERFHVFAMLKLLNNNSRFDSLLSFNNDMSSLFRKQSIICLMYAQTLQYLRVTCEVNFMAKNGHRFVFLNLHGLLN